MDALAYWKLVTMDRSDLLETLIALLAEHQVRYCVVGGQAVNAYAEPVVSLDLDLVVATDHLDEVERLLAKEFQVKHYPHSLNVYLANSAVRVQIQTDPRYMTFPQRASRREILGLTLPVASAEDTLQGTIWAVMDTGRPPSQRQKDLADIARLIEVFPALREMVPAEV